MAKDNLSMAAAHDSDRYHAWRAVRRQGIGHKPTTSDGVANASASDRDRNVSNLSVLRSIGARPLRRTHALWILVGALWISIGMIVSATLVTVAFLA